MMQQTTSVHARRKVKTYEQELQELIKLQVRLRDLAYSAMHQNRFDRVREYYHSHFNCCERKWLALITELRGWGEFPFDGNGNRFATRPEWLAYCNQQGLAWDYDLSDVIA